MPRLAAQLGRYRRLLAGEPSRNSWWNDTDKYVTNRGPPNAPVKPPPCPVGLRGPAGLARFLRLARSVTKRVVGFNALLGGPAARWLTLFRSWKGLERTALDGLCEA